MSEDNAELEDEDSGIFWTQDEGAAEDNPGEILSRDRKVELYPRHSGRVEGEYSVWLADGRLMTVVFWSFSFSYFPRANHKKSYVSH